MARRAGGGSSCLRKAFSPSQSIWPRASGSATRGCCRGGAGLPPLEGRVDGRSRPGGGGPLDWACVLEVDRCLGGSARLCATPTRLFGPPSPQGGGRERARLRLGRHLIRLHRSWHFDRLRRFGRRLGFCRDLDRRFRPRRCLRLPRRLRLRRGRNLRFRTRRHNRLGGHFARRLRLGRNFDRALGLGRRLRRRRHLDWSLLRLFGLRLADHLRLRRGGTFGSGAGGISGSGRDGGSGSAGTSTGRSGSGVSAGMVGVGVSSGSSGSGGRAGGSSEPAARASQAAAASSTMGVGASGSAASDDSATPPRSTASIDPPLKGEGASGAVLALQLFQRVPIDGRERLVLGGRFDDLLLAEGEDFLEETSHASLRPPWLRLARRSAAHRHGR